MSKVKVLVVDDSALVREILAQGLAKDPDIEVVGTASDPYVARDKIVRLRPDVLTLDVEMPRMDGIEFLRKLMPQFPIPVVMVSALTERGKRITLDALEAGAVDFVTKPSSDVARGLNAMIAQLRTKVKQASRANVSAWKGKKPIKPSRSSQGSSRVLTGSTDKVIAIGASTGGTEAIKSVIMDLPPATPGIVIVQHMPAGFTKMFAERLDSLCAMEVKEAVDGDRVLTGRVLIAPGGLHMKVVRSGGIYTVKCEQGPLVCGHCPSVEVLMESVAQNVGSNAIGVMLTGMGSDGAEGMLKLRKTGAKCIGQDKETSIVYGMPKVAFEKGAVQEQVPIQKIGDRVLKLVSEISK
jgi:two-component system chemotaxis response regulator CheB